MTPTIPEYHEGYLRSGSLTPRGQKLPDAIVAKYWEYKRVFDRMNGGNLQLGDFARIAIDCGYGKEVEADVAPPTIAELWKAKKLKSQAPIKVLWLGEAVDGKLVRVNADGDCVVRVNGHPQEQLVKADQVSLPAAA